MFWAHEQNLRGLKNSSVREIEVERLVWLTSVTEKFFFGKGDTHNEKCE